MDESHRLLCAAATITCSMTRCPRRSGIKKDYGIAMIPEDGDRRNHHAQGSRPVNGCRPKGEKSTIISGPPFAEALSETDWRDRRRRADIALWTKIRIPRTRTSPRISSTQGIVLTGVGRRALIRPARMEHLREENRLAGVSVAERSAHLALPSRVPWRARGMGRTPDLLRRCMMTA